MKFRYSNSITTIADIDNDNQLLNSHLIVETEFKLLESFASSYHSHSIISTHPIRFHTVLLFLFFLRLLHNILDLGSCESILLILVVQETWVSVIMLHQVTWNPRFPFINGDRFLVGCWVLVGPYLTMEWGWPWRFGGDLKYVLFVVLSFFKWTVRTMDC